jgi:hypothetical protein
MTEERSWRVEIKWWISAFAALLATLAIFALILAVFSLATTSQADLAKAGITDPLGDAIGKAMMWPIAEVFAFPAFMLAAALAFRLLVPTFAGVPPRTMAMIVMSWPIGLGSLVVSSDVPFSLFLVAIAIVWALVIPMPKRTVLTDNPVKGGIIVGLTLGALSPILTLILAIVWCALRLYRRKSLEVAATAMCAAIVPALFLASQLRQGTRGANAVEITIEVLILAALSLAGFIRWEFFSAEDADEDADAYADGQDADAVAVAADVTEPAES